MSRSRLAPAVSLVLAAVVAGTPSCGALKPAPQLTLSPPAGGIEFVCAITAPKGELADLDEQVANRKTDWMTAKAIRGYRDYVSFYPDTTNGWTVETSDETRKPHFIKKPKVAKKTGSVSFTVARSFSERPQSLLALIVKYEDGHYDHLTFPSSEVLLLKKSTVDVGSEKLRLE
jgi:hypothetical protein